MLKKNKIETEVLLCLANRDEPLTRDEVVELFLEGTGRAPTEAEIEEIRPDSADTVRRYRAHR